MPFMFDLKKKKTSVNMNKDPFLFVLGKANVALLLSLLVGLHVAFLIGLHVNFLGRHALSSSSSSSSSLEVQELILQKPPRKDGMGVAASVTFSYNHTLSVSKKEKSNLLPLPDNPGTEGASLQISSDLFIVVGGFTKNYNGAVSTIQFLNITTQDWMPERTIVLPPHVGQTHQGTAFDPNSGWLYIVSGQLGGGCGPATNATVRVHLATRKVQTLPPIPEGRYNPGAAIVDGRHLHVFGGAASNRYHAARDHWRLILPDNHLATEDPNDSLAEEATWEALSPPLDGGTHGRAFGHDGYIYYTGFCDLDQPTFYEGDITDMKKCQRNAVNFHQQRVHHSVASGLTMRYVTEFAKPGNKNNIGHWERLPDLPFPACHMGMTITNDAAVFVGGGLTTKQTKSGSPPVSVPYVQVFDMTRQSWRTLGSLPYDQGKKGQHLYNLMVWVDQSRNHLYGMRGEGSLVAGHWDTSGSPTGERMNKNRSRHNEFATNKLAYLKETVSIRVNAFQTCIGETPGAENLVYATALDQNSDKNVSSSYEHLRTTWNRAKDYLQYPDIVALPASAKEVSMVVQCAIMSGQHVCGRNGKHSFEGDTCTHGVVVDVSKINHVVPGNNDSNLVRMGAGLTLGRVAVDVEHKHGMVVPAGHCATVGVTGLTLVGGQGILSRLYGMTSDFVSAVELVDAEGRIIRATKDNEYADYLWLARGGGSSVQHFPGLITEIEMKDLPVPEAESLDSTTYTLYRIECRDATVPNAVKLLTAWQDFYTDPQNLQDPLFDRITVEPWIFMERVYTKKIRVTTNTVYDENSVPYKKKLFLAVYFYGTEELHAQFKKRFVPKLDKIAAGIKHRSTKMERMTTLDFHKYLAGVKTSEQLASGQDGWDLNESWKGYSAAAIQPAPPEAFQKLAENILEAKPYSRRYAEIKPLGGKIRKMDKSETAFWHRDALWWVLSSHFFHKERVQKWEDTLRRSTQKRHDKFISSMGETFGGMYAGYINHGSALGRDLELYYGDNAQKISDIKMARDPYNVFQIYVPNSLENAPYHLSS